MSRNDIRGWREPEKVVRGLSPTHRYCFRCARVLVFVTLLVLTNAKSGQTAECPAPPGNPSQGNRTVCEEPADSTDNIVIKLKDFDIDTSGRDKTGVKALHEGSGDIRVRIDGGSIKTDGLYGYGIFTHHHGTSAKKGKTDIEVKDGEIETKGQWAVGIAGTHRIQGDLNLRLRDSTIKTDGSNGFGIMGLQTGTGDLVIDLKGGSVETKDDDSSAIWGRHGGTGKLRIINRDLAILTHKDRSHGIFGFTFGSTSRTNGTIVDVKGGSINTKGDKSIGIFGWHQDFKTTSDDPRHDMSILMSGTSMTTTGVSAHGIVGYHNSFGDVNIEVSGDSSIRTTGENAVPVYGFHTYSKDRRISILVDEGATLRATGKNAHGITVGRFNANSSAIEGAASIGTDGYRQQTVVVNGQVTGGTDGAAGVRLAGGGRAVIRGQVGSDSGIAIHSARKLDTDPVPHLRVDFHLDEGEEMSSLIGDDWIVNDGGGTTISVNGVVLHHRTDGVTGAWAPNGAWDVAILKEGVKLTNPTNLGNWKTEAEEGVLDRDFSAADFVRVRAARSAIYEVLPVALLQLDREIHEDYRLRSPGSALWLGMNTRFVSNAVRDGSMGTRCRSTLSTVEVGNDIPTTGSVTGFVAGRFIHGVTEVASSVGSGRIGSTGIGITAGINRQVSDDLYTRGNISVTRYKMNLSSLYSGELGRGFGAWGLGYRAEVGQHFESQNDIQFTAHAWLNGKILLLDSLTDAVNSTVSLTDGRELYIGTGLVAKSDWRLGSSEQSVMWRGSIEVEAPIDGSTTVNLSGERLVSEAPKARLRLGLGAEWGRDDMKFNAAIETSGGGVRETAVQFRVQMNF